MFLLACAAPAPEVACPEGAAPHEVTPVQGGRAVWCERKNGARFGPFVEYRPDGTRWKEGYFIGTRKEGTFLWYHPNGQVMERSVWKMNKRDGERVLYDEHGTVTRSEVWAAGERVSSDPPDAPLDP